MDDITTHVSSTITELGNMESPLATTIHTNLHDELASYPFTETIGFFGVLGTVKQDIKESEDVDDVYARGLDDAIEGIKKLLDLFAGQINVSKRVVAAGADRFKASESLENAKAAVERANELIQSTDEFVNEKAAESDDLNATDVGAKADDAQAELLAIKSALDASIKALRG